MSRSRCVGSTTRANARGAPAAGSPLSIQLVIFYFTFSSYAIFHNLFFIFLNVPRHVWMHNAHFVAKEAEPNFF